MKTFTALFLTITCLFSAANFPAKLMANRPNGGIMQALGMYDQPKDTIDVVCLGSSHVNYGINTSKMWEEYGISAYDYASAEQPLWISYYYLREVCKYQKPRVVVLDFFSPAAFLDDYKNKYFFLRDAISGLRYSLNKQEMIETATDGLDDLTKEYLASYTGAESDADEAALEAAWEKDYSSFKGYTPAFKQSSLETPVPNVTDVLPPSDKSVQYLKKIIDFTNSRGIQLYITVVPYKLNVEQQEGLLQQEDLRYNWLEYYISDLKSQGYNNVYFDYTFKHLQDIGIDYEGGTHFADGNSHLNYYGSTRFTRYLSEDFLNRYGEAYLPDHRGDPRYSSWDANVAELKAQVAGEGWVWQ